MFVDFKGQDTNQILYVARIGQGKGIGGYSLICVPVQSEPQVDTYISRFSYKNWQSLINKWRSYGTDWQSHTIPPDCVEGCFEYFLRDNKDLLDDAHYSNWVLWLRINSHLSPAPLASPAALKSDTSPPDSVLTGSTGDESVSLPSIPPVTGALDSPNNFVDPTKTTPIGPDPNKVRHASLSRMIISS